MVLNCPVGLYVVYTNIVKYGHLLCAVMYSSIFCCVVLYGHVRSSMVLCGLVHSCMVMYALEYLYKIELH